MSIASEITRLQTAKVALKTAIEGKGVTVPSATLLDGYADLVDDIPSGGGSETIQGEFFTAHQTVVTVGSNSVNSTNAALAYLKGLAGVTGIYSKVCVEIVTEPATRPNNLFLGRLLIGGNPGTADSNFGNPIRYRDNQAKETAWGDNYDAVLPVGAEYLVSWVTQDETVT